LWFGDLSENTNNIINLSRKSHELGAHLLVFPELALSGYPPEDLLLRKGFIDQVDLRFIVA
jgi:NAD+ synthase (glutamine-hydrolysing)